MKCNLTEEEQKQAIERPFLCTAEEADFIEHCFTGYLFFEHEADEENRLGVRTTCSYCNAQTWHTEREWKCFKGKTKCGDTLRCPACGNTVTLYPRGRLRSGKTMDEDRQIVLLRAEGDSLRAVALCAWKHHGRRESDAAEFVVKASYYIRDEQARARRGDPTAKAR